MKTLIINFILLLLFSSGCKKSEYLDAVPDQSLRIPNTLEYLQAILDNKEQMNGTIGFPVGISPGIGEVSADNYYASKTFLKIMPALTISTYIWSDDIYTTGLGLFNDWALPYRAIYNANIVLDGLQTLEIRNDQQGFYNNARGSALFYRAHMLYQLAQVFTPHYNALTAENIPGLPLRMASDINERISRSTVKETYDQVITDLLEARYLLPVNVTFKTRPSLPAVFALLARTYLTMGKFEEALKYADSCLQITNVLVDYNNTPNTSSWTLKETNDEVLFTSALISTGDLLYNYLARIDSNLYKSYESADLRKGLYFSDASIYGEAESYYFKGSYIGGTNAAILFGGLATDEVYLIKAECNARVGNIKDAMSSLNVLLRNRYESGLFTDMVAGNMEEALQIILQERRKELIFRGLRWTDLRRLNATGENITIIREVDGIKYTLQPNSAHYTFLFPPDVMAFHPDWEQNPR